MARRSFAGIMTLEVLATDQRERIMENALIPIIVTIGISTLIIVASVLGTFVVLLNYLSSRIEQSEARLTSAAAKDKAELQEQMRTDKSELLETIRDTERRLTHRMDRSDDRIERFEIRNAEQFEALRRELRQSAAEQPVAGDD